MAVITRITARNMGRILASRDGSVVAGSAGTDHIEVIDGVSGRENVRVMAVFTDLGCLYVVDILANGVCTVMTAAAIVENIVVTEDRRQPPGRGVAIVTIRSTRNVGGVFADGCDAVMTRAASAQHLGVIYSESRCPDIRRVAVLADVGRLNM